MTSALAGLSAHWLRLANLSLLSGESPLVALQPDLDDRLHAARALVLLTGQRLMAWSATDVEGSPRCKAGPCARVCTRN